MKKTKVLLFIFIVISLLGSLLIQGFNLENTIKEPEYNRTHTKAICNSDNFCQDFEIFCMDKETVRIKPLTASVQFQKDWKNPRNEETISRLC